jgi:hypothetical protein
VVQRELALAAARVPAPRRARRPRIGGFRIEAKGAALRASVSVKDGYDPPFSVGFLLAHRGARWRIVAVSPPS